MFRNTPWSALASVALLVAITALSQPLAADSLLSAEHAGSSGPLDGMAFQGQLGPADDNGDVKSDTLYFRNGHFWSKICVPCGFLPARYWVHRAEDGIHFRGTLESPESGTFHYTGVVRDGRISVSIDWNKERWYWTVNREFEFEGELSDDGKSFATLDTAKATAVSALEAGKTCEPG